MRTYTTTVREGERVGDIDWNYDFRQHFDNLCTSDERRDEACRRSVDRLRSIVEAKSAGKRVTATTDGGWPKFGFREVVDVAMYDGWPYWRPVPSVCRLGVLGGVEWSSFCSVTEFSEA